MHSNFIHHSDSEMGLETTKPEFIQSSIIRLKVKTVTGVSPLVQTRNRTIYLL